MQANPGLIRPPTGQVRLRNRWRDNHYIHIEHRALETGAIEPGWRSATWIFQPVENSPFVFIRSGLLTDFCLQLQESGLACGLLQADWQGAHWYIERSKGTAFVRFRNRWQQDCYIHCETGTPEATPIKDTWQSAQWECV